MLTLWILFPALAAGGFWPWLREEHSGQNETMAFTSSAPFAAYCFSATGFSFSDFSPAGSMAAA